MVSLKQIEPARALLIHTAMDSENFSPKLNFSLLNLLEIKKNGVTSQEIASVWHNPRTVFYNLEGFEPKESLFRMVGFSSSSRFLQVALNYQLDEVTFLQVEIANEDEIRSDYCGQ